MVFFLSSLKRDSFKLLDGIYAAFAEGKLKGQSVSRSNKGINSFPDLKGSTFKPFRGLDVTTIHLILLQIFNKECSLKEAASQCNDIKSLQRIQSAFMKLTNVETWEDAVEKYPTFTTVQKLEPFKTLNFTNPKVIPPQFFKFCQHAMASPNNAETENGDELFHIENNDVQGTIWKCNALSINPENFKATSITSCHGFGLAIFDLANGQPPSLKGCDLTKVCTCILYMYDYYIRNL